MITLLTGENSFEIRRALEVLANSFDGHTERIDGSELELRHLPDLLMGGTLFADKRLVIMRQLSDNKAVWPALSDWLPRVSEDVHLVLVEPKPDKRTKSYKDLSKLAVISDYPLWSERDQIKAEGWLLQEATQLGFKLDKQSSHELVTRIGVDQWGLFHALEKLAVLDVVTPDVIRSVIEARPQENVFLLFEAALKGDTSRVHTMIQTVALSEDPYMLFGLLSGQAFQLVALAQTDKPGSEVAKELSVHPYALSKLALFARSLGKSGAKRILSAFVKADDGLKLSRADPWLLLEQALLLIASK